MGTEITHQSRLIQESRTIFDTEHRTATNLAALSFPSLEVKLGRYRLQIPEFIERQMARLDQSICERNIHSEVGGFGLTARVDPYTYKIVEFHSPEHALFIAEGSLSKKLRAALEGIAESEVVQVSATDRQIQIGFARKGRAARHDIALRDSYEVADALLVRELLAAKKIETKEGATPDDLAIVIRDRLKHGTPIDIETRFDSVMTVQGIYLAHRFYDRVAQREAVTELKANFYMHHHPRIFNWLAESSVSQERHAYFRQLLTLSPQDLRTMKKWRIEFAELRTLGSPRAPFGFGGRLTRRFFHLG